LLEKKWREEDETTRLKKAGKEEALALMNLMEAENAAVDTENGANEEDTAVKEEKAAIQLAEKEKEEAEEAAKRATLVSKRKEEKENLESVIAAELESQNVRAGVLGHDRHCNAYCWFRSDKQGIYIQPAKAEGGDWRVWGGRDLIRKVSSALDPRGVRERDLIEALKEVITHTNPNPNWTLSRL